VQQTDQRLKRVKEGGQGMGKRCFGCRATKGPNLGCQGRAGLRLKSGKVQLGVKTKPGRGESTNLDAEGPRGRTVPG